MLKRLGLQGKLSYLIRGAVCFGIALIITCSLIFPQARTPQQDAIANEGRLARVEAKMEDLGEDVKSIKNTGTLVVIGLLSLICEAGFRAVTRRKI